VARAGINVEINIAGDVVDSDVIGINLPDGRSAKIRDALFNRVFFEYLSLPTISEVLARIDRITSTPSTGIREFDFSKASALLRLWMAVLQDLYGFCQPHTFMLDMYANGELAPREEWAANESPLRSGDWIKLRNVHLSPFVNRSPGKFFLGGWRFTSGHSPQEENNFAISERIWTWEDYAVRTMGIGDVRIGELDGFVMLQASAATGAVTSATDGGGAAISALGFPILVESLVYNRLKTTIENFGAVAIDSLYARVAEAGENTGLIWAAGVPKLILVALDRHGMGSPSVPNNMHSSIWTVAEGDDMSKFHYCTWGFVNGSRDYRKNLAASVGVIRTAMEERGLRAVFEFDIEQNWFGEDTRFGPSQIKSLSKKLMKQAGAIKAVELNAIDAGAEHSIEQALRDDDGRLSPKIEMLMSRALAMIQVGRYSEALTLTAKLLEDQQNIAFCWHLHAMGLYYTHATEEAIVAWKRALALTKSYSLRDRVTEILSQIEQPGGGTK
jgi:hypothetical protein